MRVFISFVGVGQTIRIRKSYGCHIEILIDASMHATFQQFSMTQNIQVALSLKFYIFNNYKYYNTPSLFSHILYFLFHIILLYYFTIYFNENVLLKTSGIFILYITANVKKTHIHII